MELFFHHRCVLLVIITFSATFATGQNISSAADLAALYSLRASLGLRARDWPRRADPCSVWVGVGCDGGGRVVSLDLYGLRRTRLGRRNPRFAVDGIQNLTRLASFNATGFALPGSIPVWFGSGLPPSLAILDLHRASISGEIPYSLGGAVMLVVLSLADNSISGTIPSSLGQLTNLSVLDLSQNALSGTVPPAFNGLVKLSFLDLSSNLLTGSVPPAIGTLQKLKTVNLSHNSLTGVIPPQLSDLSFLVSLDLSFNSLFGPLPDSFNYTKSLENLNLRANSLNGSLSVDLFSRLSQLQSISLSSNKFFGQLPDSLWTLPDLQFVDVSHNNFTGRLPELVSMNTSFNGSTINISHNLLYGSLSSGFSSLLSRFRSVDISENYLEGLVTIDSGVKNLSIGLNCFLNVSNQRSPAACEEFYRERGIRYEGLGSPTIAPAPSPSSSSSKGKKTWKYIVIAVVCGTTFLVFMVISIVLCLRKCITRPAEQRVVNVSAAAQSADVGGVVPPTEPDINSLAVGEGFSYEQLASATVDFAEQNLIKHGHSGDIYKGVLENGILVVVKRIDMANVRKDMYLVELDLFSRFSHNRLVPFLGCCLEKENEKFLVYRQMPHRDLSNALYRLPMLDEDGLQSLDWITRLKIATGVAEGLCFMHQECRPPLVHRDIQASSILLDEKFEVRLGSLSYTCAQEGENQQSAISRFLRMSHTSEPSSSGLPPASCAYDVYCFGKVLLELVTGKLGISGSNDASTNEWLEQTLSYIDVYEKELVTKILDPSLVVDEDLLEEVWAMAIVARSCLNPKPSKRPLMKHILKALENPLKVVREDSSSGPSGLRAGSSRSLWNAAFFGSWRQSSREVAAGGSALPRDARSFRRSGTIRSEGSVGDHSSHRRPSKEIFPEPRLVDD
ncbi:hypothetical protein HPP92_023344 [Vanilla planifolia]|uniref:Protein kinase domain-containing protein n=1 Tax=Vanilla planifolia TaxID=51239 RepID=A0A835PXG1_VANPL|nr:hypothetical protein HPP92_023344 [Vanilla planifolia]